MKVVIKQSVLLKSLEKAAVAALSDEAQTDTTNLSALIKSVKIKVDEKYSVESSTNILSTKFEIPATEDNGIGIEEKGEILIQAKELYDWVKIQGPDSNISIKLNKLSTPEMITTADNADDASDQYSIKKIGNVVITAKDSTKSSSKWELDCYDPQHLPVIDYSKNGKRIFDIYAEKLTNALNKISFASTSKDYQHILDSVSIQVFEKNIYFATTDTKRCALIKVEDATKIETEDPILISVALMNQVAKISEKTNNLSFYYNEDENRIFIEQDGLNIRIASCEKNSISKFPPIIKLLNKKYAAITTIPKGTLNKMLVSSALVNKSSALFEFKASDNTLSVKAISEDSKYKPSITKAKLDSVTSDVTSIWGVSHLMDVLKVIKSDKVIMSIPDNQNSVQITGDQTEDKGFIYFAMVINNAKYKTN